MNPENKNLDDLVTDAIGRDGLKFDFNKWKNEHEKEVQTYNSQTTEQDKHPARIYRTGKIIMKKKITKLASAALIILAVTLLLGLFGTLTDSAGTAWAKVLESTNKIPWIRVNFTNLIDSNSPGYAKTGEHWFNASSKIGATKCDVSIDYADYKNMIRYTYDLQKNELLINIIPYLPGMFYEGFYTNTDFLEARYKLSLNSENRKVKKSGGEYQGKKVTIYTIDANIYSLTGNPYTANEIEKYTLVSIYKREIYVDPETNLIIAIFHKSIEPSSGKPIQDTISTFSYPEKGPQSIYDLGVPKDARIIDKTYQQTADPS